MATNYDARLKYEFTNSRGTEKKLTVPIIRFEVDGGATRVIKMESTNDISLTSELEQARTFKNLILGMPPLRNGDDMRAALELAEAAVNKFGIFVNFYLYKYADGKPLEGLRLLAWEAKIKKPPQIVKNLLKIEISLSSSSRVEIERIVLNPGKKPKTFPF